jgi:predicted nucleic acid-binding protein
MNVNIIVDSGFWFALYDIYDDYHTRANNIVEYLDVSNIIIPFPTLYESLNTKFMKNTVAKIAFESILKRSNVTIVNDDLIKADALKITFTDESKKRNLSLVDNIIRLILDDVNYKIDYLITFNRKDFIDICRKRTIEIIDY